MSRSSLLTSIPVCWVVLLGLAVASQAAPNRANGSLPVGVQRNAALTQATMARVPGKCPALRGKIPGPLLYAVVNARVTRPMATAFTSHVEGQPP